MGDNSPDNNFDLIIDLDPTQDSRTNVEAVVRELHRKYPLLITTVPSDEDLDKAVKAAIEDYKPDLKHTIPDRNKKQDRKPGQQTKNAEPQASKKKALEYMSISIPAQDIRVALESACANLY